MFDNFDDDELDLDMSEAEEWYDNNLRFFDWKNHTPGMPLGVELFYYSVYKPFMSDLKKPLRAMIADHYPHIGKETRVEVLKKVDNHIDYVGHEFLLFLRRMIEFGKTGADLRELYPKLDEWAAKYPTYRKPRYLDESFWDKLEWLSPEMKEEMILESRKEADELFAFEEKPRFEFFSLLQSLVFRYYPEIQDMDKDGWAMYEAFLADEYTNYQLDFEHYECFIDYGFEIEDLDLPYEEYQKKFSEKWKVRHDEEVRQRENDRLNNKENA